MKVTVPSSWPVTLDSLISSAMFEIINSRRTHWEWEWENFCIDLFHSSNNTVVFDTLELASITSSRPVVKDVWISFIIRELSYVSLLASAPTDIFVTIV